MPPNQPTQGSGNPNDYGFIFQNPQKSGGLKLPKLNLPKPAKIGLIVIFVLMLLLIVASLRGGGGQTSSPSLNVAARQQEMLRVSKIAQNNLQDQQAKNMQIGVTSALTTDESQLIKVLGIKAGDGRLRQYQNKNIDSTLQTASQNNNYDDTYLGYIKQSLQTYIQEIQAAQATATGAVKDNLQNDLNNAQLLLASPDLKNL